MSETMAAIVTRWTRTATRLTSAWQLVAKRSLANWRLLSSVVLGVLLASAIMAGTVIYFDALKETALKSTLARIPPTELDILVQGTRGPTTRPEFLKTSEASVGVMQKWVAWMLKDSYRAGKTPTFYLATPGNESEAGGGNNDRAFFAFLPRLKDNITILPWGRLPQDVRLSEPGEPTELEAIIPEEAAALFEVEVGDRLIAVPTWADDIPFVSVVVSGIFQRNNLDSELWYLEREALLGSTGADFRTVPFYVSETAFLEVLGPSLRKLDSTYIWLLDVDEARLNADNANLAASHIGSMGSSLDAILPRYLQSTVLVEAIGRYDRRLFFTRLPMFMVLVLIGVVIVYYVATLSSLIVEDRRSEVVLLRSRGATSSQILTVFILEGATIAAIAIVAGPLLAAGAISILGLTPAFTDLTGGALLDVGISRDAYLMSGLGGVIGLVALVFPAVQASRIGVIRHRQEAARPSAKPLFQRYYLDVLLLLVSIYLFRQLTEQGSVVATRLVGENVVNELLLALPGLTLLAAAMVLLRVFPLAMDLGSRLFSSWLPTGLVMGVWQIARSPTHYARLSLLLILTAGLGIFASSFGATLQRSFQERVLYSAGSDLRVEQVGPGDIVTEFRTPAPSAGATLVAAYEMLEGVERASPVLRTSGLDTTRAIGTTYEMLGVEAESFSKVAFFREDFSTEPMETLLSALAAPDPITGITLPDDARAIGVRVRPDQPHSNVRVSARIRDAQGEYSTYILGNLVSDAWSVLETDLGFGLRQSLERSRPLTLVALRVHEIDAFGRLQAGSIQIDDVRVSTESGETRIIEEFNDSSGWTPLQATPNAVADALRPAGELIDGESGSVIFSWTAGSPRTARGIFHAAARSALPVLASRTFVDDTGHAEGREFNVMASGHRIPVRIAGVVDLFPTMTVQGERFLVSDLDSLTRYANLSIIGGELLPNQVWMSVSGIGPDRDGFIRDVDGVTGAKAGTIKVYDREERLEQSRVDPLINAGWRSLLFIAFSAVLILSILGFLVHAYVSYRSRMLQFALLRTVGVSISQLITMVWLEQTLVVAIGMALGTWMGGRLGAIIMPFLGHDDWGDKVVPPFATEVDWPTLLVTYGIMLLVFSAITMALIWLIHRISLHRVLRLGEA
jgi:ABC-type antimicrobial peptide transport system permease subunit